MQLTEAGEELARADDAIKRQHYGRLLRGDLDIEELVIKGICFDVVAYTVFLNGAFNINQIHGTSGQNWVSLFNFPGGTQWGGGDEAIAEGTAVGFFSTERDSFFHAAVATGNGAEVRSVNGGLLGAGWLTPANLKTVLNVRNQDGTFDFDREKIRVWKSPVNSNSTSDILKWTSAPVSSYPNLNWQSAQFFGYPFTSAAAPALAADQNTLWCMHRGGGNNQELWYMNYNSQFGWGPIDSEWKVTLPQSIPQSFAGPALAFDSSNQLWCGYGGAGANIKTTASPNGFNWGTIYGSDVSFNTSPAGPALANFNDAIWLIFSDSANNRLMTGRFVDGSLAGMANAGNNYTTTAPALCAFKNQLWCVYRKDNNDLYVTTSSNFQTWTDGIPIPNQTSDCGPSLAYMPENDTLLCVYGDGNGGSVFYYTYNASGDPATWSTPMAINGNPRAPGTGVGLAEYQGNIYCAYRSA